MQHAPLTGLLLLFLLLTVCLGGGEDAVQDTAVSLENAIPQSGQLECAEGCLSIGQCGTTADGRTVILAHSTKASTLDHDTLLPNDIAVSILQVEPHTVQVGTNNPLTLNFYVVRPLEGGPASFVAGSCVNTQQ